jgi:hypothetical protein
MRAISVPTFWRNEKPDMSNISHLAISLRPQKGNMS